MKKVVLCTRNYIRDAMKLSGSEIIIECLKREGVEYIFGMWGIRLRCDFEVTFK